MIDVHLRPSVPVAPVVRGMPDATDDIEVLGRAHCFEPLMRGRRRRRRVGGEEGKREREERGGRGWGKRRRTLSRLVLPHAHLK